MKRTLGALLVLALIGAAATGWYLRFGSAELPSANIEAIRRRDLEAIVIASGKVRPKRQVNVSANTMGKVTRLGVKEGQRVTVGQFLLEIDPRSLAGQLQRGEASVAAARSGLAQTRTSIDQVRAQLELSRQLLQRQNELWKEGLTTRESLDRAENEVRVRGAELATREQESVTREEQIKQEQASLETTRYSLSQVIINSPIEGIITRRSVEEGETAIVGTMNNPGTVLLTIADMSVVEAEVEVDETDIPLVSLGQEARVTIDALPDKTFQGVVTEIGNSPILAINNQNNQRATNFKVVITLDPTRERPVEVRPGFSCIAQIVTAKRPAAIALPIQALTVREMLFDQAGKLVREPPRDRSRRPGSSVEPTVAAAEPPPGHTRKETEGVFVLDDARAVFVSVKTGIVGERHFEVIDGLAVGDTVITGPFSSLRQLTDGEAVAQGEPDSR